MRSPRRAIDESVVVLGRGWPRRRGSHCLAGRAPRHGNVRPGRRVSRLASRRDRRGGGGLPAWTAPSCSATSPPSGRASSRAVLTVGASPGAAAAYFVRPRYTDDPAPNPVLVRRAAWALAEGLVGDWGLGPLMASHPNRVVEVPVEGANPDVDTPADLATMTAGPEDPR